MEISGLHITRLSQNGDNMLHVLSRAPSVGACTAGTMYSQMENLATWSQLCFQCTSTPMENEL